MGDVEDYRKRLEGSASGGNFEDYYKLARDQEYNLLLNKEVALENAKSNAMKYTQNQINAQGFGGTGYGSSLQSGTYNNYVNKANEAYANYGENIKNINMQENEAKLAEANDRFESVTTMLQQADNVDSMNKLLTDYGYGTIGEDGTFTWNAQKPEGMSDDDWYQMQYYYGLQKNAFDEEASANKAGYANNETAFRGMQIHIDGEKGSTMGDSFNKETTILFAHLTSGDISNGDYVKMTNGHGKVIYVQYTKDGFRVASESEYNDSENKHEIVRNKKNDYSWK